MSYEIDDELSLIRCKWRGKHNTFQVQDYMKEMLNDPNLRLGLNYLSDQLDLETTPTPASEDTGTILLNMIAEKIGPFKYAIVTKEVNDEQTDRRVNKFSNGAPVEVCLFASIEEAENWLKE